MKTTIRIFVLGFLIVLSGSATAQGLKGKLKGVGGKVAAPEPAPTAAAPEDTSVVKPAIETEFYSEVNAKDNKREKKEDKGKAELQKLSKLKNDFPGIKYRRSSIYTLMVHNEENPHWNVIAKAFGDFEMPEKFNDHNLDVYQIESKLRGKELEAYLYGYLNEKQMAKELVSKWFNRGKNGGFDMDLVAARGYYNASDLDVKLAKSSQRGLATLGDAGEELIKNTFIIINDYKFMSLKDYQESIGQALDVAEKTTSIFRVDLKEVKETTQIAGDMVAVVAGETYVVKSTSYLYQLNWNDSIASIFYNEYWTDQAKPDPAKVKAYNDNNPFTLSKVGFESTFAVVPATIFTEKSNAELIDIATKKSTDKAIAKLQKIFEAFRLKTPLYSAEPLTAKIGLKEDLEKGDKFEVLEQTIDGNGKTVYNRKGQITVIADKIWDNRYMAEEEAKAQGQETPPSLDASHFDGGRGNLYSGMLIRQIK